MTKKTSSPTCSRSAAKHPDEAAQSTIDQIPNTWESVAQENAVSEVIKLSLPPPYPDNIMKSATILRVCGVISKDRYRQVWRFVATNRPRFATAKRYREQEYPICCALERLYTEGRKRQDQGIQAVRLLTNLAGRIPQRAKFSGGMYYRHILALRETIISYWKYEDENRRN